MALRAACPTCRMPGEFPDHAAGQRVKCPICQAPFMLSAGVNMGRQQQSSSGSGGLIVALVVGLGLLFFCGVGVLGAGLFYFRAAARPMAQQPPQPIVVPAPMTLQPTPAPWNPTIEPPPPIVPLPSPNAGRPVANPSAPVTAELSNGRYHLQNGKLLFAVDYAFPGGLPPLGSQLCLAVNAGDGRRFEMTVFNARVEAKGTLQGEAIAFGAVGGPFKACLEYGRATMTRTAISPAIDLTEDSSLKQADPLEESRKRHEDVMAEMQERTRKAREEQERRINELRERMNRPQ